MMTAARIVVKFQGRPSMPPPVDKAELSKRSTLPSSAIRHPTALSQGKGYRLLSRLNRRPISFSQYYCCIEPTYLLMLDQAKTQSFARASLSELCLAEPSRNSLTLGSLNSLLALKKLQRCQLAYSSLRILEDPPYVTYPSAHHACKWPRVLVSLLKGMSLLK